MDTYVDIIPTKLILFFIISGVFMYIIFYGINHYIIPIQKTKNKRITTWWSRFQIIMWILLFSVYFYTLLKTNLYITLTFAVLIFGLGWQYWNNIFSGIMMIFNNQLKTGDVIISDFANGEVQEIKLDKTAVINDKGELVLVPNSNFRTKVFKQLNKKTEINTHQFYVNTANKESDEEVYKFVMNCPYISANQIVSVEREKDNQYSILLSVLDNSFVEKTADYLAEYQ